MPCASGLFWLRRRWWSAARLSSFLNPEWVEGPKSGDASEPRRHILIYIFVSLNLRWLDRLTLCARARLASVRRGAMNQPHHVVSERGQVGSAA